MKNKSLFINSVVVLLIYWIILISNELDILRVIGAWINWLLLFEGLFLSILWVISTPREQRNMWQIVCVFGEQLIFMEVLNLGIGNKWYYISLIFFTIVNMASLKLVVKNISHDISKQMDLIKINEILKFDKKNLKVQLLLLNNISMFYIIGMWSVYFILGEIVKLNAVFSLIIFAPFGLINAKRLQLVGFNGKEMIIQNICIVCGILIYICKNTPAISFELMYILFYSLSPFLISFFDVREIVDLYR